MADALLFSLPAAGGLQSRAAHWWHIVDSAIVDAGADEAWLALALAAATGRQIIALAPAGDVRFLTSERSGTGNSDRQAAAIARIEAVNESLGGAETLHAVSQVVPSDPSRVATAIVANGTMITWLDWCRGLGVDPNHLVPVASLVTPAGDEWIEAQIGGEHIAARRGLAMAYEPELAEALGAASEVRTIPDQEVQAALVRVAEAPWLDLRTGKFARRRRIVIDRDRIRELVLLACVLPLLTLAWAMLSILQIERSTDKLNAETLRVAEAALPGPTTLETAEADLRQRTSGGGGGALLPLSALYRHLQATPGVSTTDISYRPDGTLSATVAAPAVDEINRMLIDLQRARYAITAVPRQAPDGRAMVDITIRSGP